MFFQKAADPTVVTMNPDLAEDSSQSRNIEIKVYVYKPLGCLHAVKVSTAERGLLAVMMDTPTISRKCLASTPHTAKACQSTTSIGSISLPCASHSPLNM